MESDYVRADMVEAAEFPDLVQKYQISGVPKTVINDSVSFVGAVPEEGVMEHIKQAAKAKGA